MQKITLDNVEAITKSPCVTITEAENRWYKLITELFVDNSGMWKEWEWALTLKQCLAEVRTYLGGYGSLYTSITSQWHFQIYLWVFYRPRSSKKDNNIEKLSWVATYKKKNPEDNSSTIFYHGTPIIHTKTNGDIDISNWGYDTVTTKKRLNQYLPARYNVTQKKYHWYLTDSIRNVTVEWKIWNSMTTDDRTITIV